MNLDRRSASRSDDARHESDDYALVLLIFILTTTYTELKMFPAPAEKAEVQQKRAKVMPTAVIHVVATMEDGKPIAREKKF
jgi:hypothetical protein